MKRIEFLAPVEAMRGNLSGDQVLAYDGGQRAYDVTGSGKVAAENYDKRYIGAKRLANGKKFFSLKTKSTTDLGANARLAMAAFGGSCSLARVASTDLTVMTRLQNTILAEIAAGKVDPHISFRNWIQKKVYPMIKAKEASVTIGEGTNEVVLNNPWISGGSGTSETLPEDVITKFQSVLGA